MGELRDQYPGGLEQRAGDIEAGAGRPAAELVRATSGGRSAAVDAGDGRAAARRHGTRRRARRGAWSRTRATRSCRAGARWWCTTATSAWAPCRSRPALVEAWLPRELPRLAERTDPAGLLAWVIGRGDAAPPVALVTCRYPETKALPERSTATQYDVRRARDAREGVAVVDEGAGAPRRAVPAEHPPDGVDGAAERGGRAGDGGQARSVGAGDGRLGGDRARAPRSRPRSRSGRCRCCRPGRRSVVEAQETELSWPWVSASPGWVQRRPFNTEGPPSAATQKDGDTHEIWLAAPQAPMLPDQPRAVVGERIALAVDGDAERRAGAVDRR